MGDTTRADQKRAVDRQGLKHSTAADDLLQSDPFAFTKDSTSGPASITTAISLAVHSAERGRVVP